MHSPIPDSHSPFDLTDRTALITGASGHLGRALAHGLAAAGARVVVSSRRLELARQVAAELPSRPGIEHPAVQLDHLNEQSIEQGFKDAVQRVSQIDILVNNGHAPLAKDWTTTTAHEFNQQMENLTGYFLLARHMRDHVVRHQAGGSIVLLGSMYGVVGSYPDVYEEIGPASPVAYQALKGGVIQMTRHLAIYWAKDGVRVNCLSPGPFPGPSASSDLVKRLEQRVPLGRIGLPSELIGPVVFLASQASSFMTGQNMIVDGGWTAW